MGGLQPCHWAVRPGLVTAKVVDDGAARSVAAEARQGAVYYCAGIRVRSSFPLAAPVADGPADVDVIEGDARPVPYERPSLDIVAERVVDGVPWYTFARCGNKVVARFYRLADFEINAAGSQVTCHPDPATAPGILAILLAGTVVSYLLSAGGRLVLHASAVEVDGVALAFVGFSGQGKTTLAALLCAEGHPLVTDDLLPVDVRDEVVTCIPGGIELRIRDKAEGLLERFGPDVTRRRTADARYALAPAVTLAERLRLAAVVTPMPDRESHHVKARRLGVGEAVMMLARCQRIEGWTSPTALRVHFEAVSAVVSSVPVFEMQIPCGPPFAEKTADDVVAAAHLAPR
jgi:hypothetical protein